MHFLERGLYWSTFAYIVCVCLAATASLLIALFAARVSSVKNAELKRFQITSAEVVAQANAGAARATAQAALSLEELKRLEGLNLELQSEVEKQRTARLRLEEQLAPRRMGAGQRQAIASALAAFKGQKVSIVVHPGDPEIATFAEQVKATLEQAGIVVSLTPALVFGKPQPGITLEVGANRRQFATALAKAFVEAGVATGPISATESETADFLEITVGPKP